MPVITEMAAAAATPPTMEASPVAAAASSSANEASSTTTDAAPTITTGANTVTGAAPATTVTGAAPATTATGADIPEVTKKLIDLISGDLLYVSDASKGLKEYGIKVSGEITEVTKTLEKLKKLDPTKHNVARLRELEKMVINLKLQIPSRYKPQSDARRRRLLDEAEGNHDMEKFPDLMKNNTLEHSLEFKDFMSLYDSLNSSQKVCLLSFSVFPDNEIIRKRFMVYWWMAEGFVRPKHPKTAEELAGQVFQELMDKDFIQPFSDKPSLQVKLCKMHPFVRSALVILAKRDNAFHFDADARDRAADEAKIAEDAAADAKKLADIAAADATDTDVEAADARAKAKAEAAATARAKVPAPYASSHQACLFATEIFEDGPEIGKIHILFNVDETEIDFEKPDTLFKMESLNILCLGRWQHSPIHHIELEDIKHLEGLKNMKFLKFLSLQGVSRIMELPGSIFCLPNLTILDLRACHSLEKIPKEIGHLKSLTHLDMSECYLLESMPKEISALSELQVLKGFVVMNYSEQKKKEAKHCTIEHLTNLKKLIKLSIHTGRNDFPDNEERKHLSQLSCLRKLTIAWGRGLKTNAAVPKPTQETTTDDTDQQQQGHKSGAKNAKPAPGLAKQPTMKKLLSMVTPKSKSVPDSGAGLPTKLEKLDLQSFPKVYAPEWLQADKLPNLKKLYIRGGTLRDLGQISTGMERQRWTEVETLRVKYLKRLEMDWRELQDLFPKLTYLEKVDCPKLTLFPCDGRGIWKKNPERFNQL